MSGGVKPLETSLVEEMISLAIRQLSFSYTPYSGFKVGAALLAEDGTLDIDRDTLRETAAGTQDINETFGSLKSFSNMLLRKSDQVSLNPMDYVEKVMVAYKNPGHNYPNPYITSAYSGMMFDGYF